MKAVERSFNPAALSPIAVSIICNTIQRCSSESAARLSELLRALAAINPDPENLDIRQHLQLAVAASVLADLGEQGWGVRVADRKIYVRPPEPGATEGETITTVKARLRNALLIGSDRQLASSAVQKFIRSMERARIFKRNIVSIRTLIDDGEDLADSLTQLLQNGTPVDDELRKVINPVLQVCDAGETCAHTGLKLQDIWRYFRHTWSLEYNPLPGRTLRILIRNKARPNWPVMGIAMLASPAANLGVRDRWIGWTVDELISRLLEDKQSAKEVAKRLLAICRKSISEIRIDDLVRREEIENPTQATYFRLNKIVAQSGARRKHDLISKEAGEEDRLVDIRTFARRKLTNKEWRQLSETGLFREKRAEQLLALLEAMSCLKAFGFEEAPAAALYEALATKDGRDAIGIVLKEIKKQRLATEIADLSVCGAVPPYNHLVAGKLVALSMMSRDAQALYEQRYETQPSEIASQMAGRRVVRSAKLKVITTTSLYGVASSQYNRLSLQARSNPELGFDLRWVELDPTEGFTVTHLSKQTTLYMRQLAAVVYGRRRINSVFGEGSSPRTRQVREGLNLIGINNDHVLEQGLKRRVYVCELFPGAREALLGFSKTKKPKRSPTMKAISMAWLRRWALGRMTRDDVVQRLRQSKSSQIEHELFRRAERARLESEELLNDDGAIEPELPLGT